MPNMFAGATSANPATSGWDTSSVTSMNEMFYGTPLANPDVSGWDTSAVTNMNGMFHGATLANPQVTGWDTSKVTNMIAMFSGATSFDRDLGTWDVSSLTNASSMFDGVTLSTAHYESLLIGWNAQTLHSGVTFSGGNSTYCSPPAVDARSQMISNDSWAISDGGRHCAGGFCNINTVSGVTDSTDTTHEACEILSVGPDYSADNNANITLSSGWEIEFQTNFSLEPGSSLNANICGQSLCLTSPSPMPDGCHSCVTLICAINLACCTTTWDQTCVDQVNWICGLNCE